MTIKRCVCGNMLKSEHSKNDGECGTCACKHYTRKRPDPVSLEEIHVIRDLRDRGLTQSEIGKRVDRKQPVISRILKLV